MADEKEPDSGEQPIEDEVAAPSRDERGQRNAASQAKVSALVRMHWRLVERLKKP
jgi:hypothetical protein